MGPKRFLEPKFFSVYSQN